MDCALNSTTSASINRYYTIVAKANHTIFIVCAFQSLFYLLLYSFWHNERYMYLATHHINYASHPLLLSAINTHNANNAKVKLPMQLVPFYSLSQTDQHQTQSNQFYYVCLCVGQTWPFANSKINWKLLDGWMLSVGWLSGFCGSRFAPSFISVWCLSGVRTQSNVPNTKSSSLFV